MKRESRIFRFRSRSTLRGLHRFFIAANSKVWLVQSYHASKKPYPIVQSHMLTPDSKSSQQLSPGTVAGPAANQNQTLGWSITVQGLIFSQSSLDDSKAMWSNRVMWFDYYLIHVTPQGCVVLYIHVGQRAWARGRRITTKRTFFSVLRLTTYKNWTFSFKLDKMIITRQLTTS